MPRFHYRCTECGKAYGRDEVRYLCPACGGWYAPGEPLRGVLEVEFDWQRIRYEFDQNNPDWSLFCAVEQEFHPPFIVGGTPLCEAEGLAEAVGLKDVLIKNDGLNPSGSLKDRASYLVVAEANRLGLNRIVTASTGNAASALAAVCAAAGREAVIFVPSTAPRGKLVQMILYGARVITVNGSYDDAFRLSLAYTEARGGLNRNTAYHPLTIEGKKTVALEIWAQNGFAIPDAVVVPVGDGVIIAGVYKGFRDLMMAGLTEKLPRLVCVQAESSDAIHHYVTTGEYRPAPAPRTVADSISVSAPSNAHMARRAIAESDGFSITVSDAEILEAQAMLARTSGIFAEPAAAAGAAGLKKSAGIFGRGDRVVLLVTGHGLKDIDAPLRQIEVPAPINPSPDALPA